MKILCLYLLIICPLCLAENFLQKVEKEQKQQIINATKANQMLSNDELMHYLKRMFKYMPEEFENLKNQNQDEFTQSLNNIKNYHSNAGINISEMINLLDENPDFEEFFAQIWAEDTIGYEYAESVLAGIPDEQYRIILETCQNLMKNNQEKTNIRDNFPESLSFLEIVTITITSTYCDVYLYLGIGSHKRVGFHVQQTMGGQWRLEQFNYIDSFDHQIIDLAQ
ncbi:MAG: hypothetical protein R3E90_13195 [Marinicella sp.]